jgi:3' terminal RNA ribose 2'-O-methyltransferase Hen1
MLLTITTTHRPATDLGYLLHKNPTRAQRFDLSVGTAHVFYTEATPERCTAVLLLDIDPVELAKGSRRQSLRQYVNDRPYVASSLMSTAILKVFGSAMGGASKDRPELAETAIPLAAHLSAIPCRGGEAVARSLFEPLGYKVGAVSHPLDEANPDWGLSNYLTLDLEAIVKLSDLLQHLYVLIPTLDQDKHYWLGPDEVDKLLDRGGEWLRSHPERDQIVRRYLGGFRNLTSVAFERLNEEELPQELEVSEEQSTPEDVAEKPIALGTQRMKAVLAVLKASGAKRVLDLGCGEGRLLRDLLAEAQFEEVVGADVSIQALEGAKAKLHLDRMAPARQARLKLLHTSLTYRDSRLAGFDAAAIVEVIEHLDPSRLAAFERALFHFARPATVVITTPNVDYNALFPTLPAGAWRHPDHRFEWTRAEFQAWSSGVAATHGYEVTFSGVGASDPNLGSPTQMAVFKR